MEFLMGKASIKFYKWGLNQTVASAGWFLGKSSPENMFFSMGFLVMFLQTNSQPCHDLECDIHWHTKRNKNLMPFFGRLFSHTMPYMPLNLVTTGNLYLRRFFSPLSTRSAHLSRSGWRFWRPWSGSLWPCRHAHSPGLTAWMGHA